MSLASIHAFNDHNITNESLPFDFIFRFTYEEAFSVVIDDSISSGINDYMVVILVLNLNRHCHKQ